MVADRALAVVAVDLVHAGAGLAGTLGAVVDVDALLLSLLADLLLEAALALAREVVVVLASGELGVHAGAVGAAAVLRGGAVVVVLAAAHHKELGVGLAAHHHGDELAAQEAVAGVARLALEGGLLGEDQLRVALLELGVVGRRDHAAVDRLAHVAAVGELAVRRAGLLEGGGAVRGGVERVADVAVVRDLLGEGEVLYIYI